MLLMGALLLLLSVPTAQANDTLHFEVKAKYSQPVERSVALGTVLDSSNQAAQQIQVIEVKKPYSRWKAFWSSTWGLFLFVFGFALARLRVILNWLISLGLLKSFREIVINWNAGVLESEVRRQAGLLNDSDKQFEDFSNLADILNDGAEKRTKYARSLGLTKDAYTDE